MVYLHSNVLVITLNINRLNNLIKRQTRWKTKHNHIQEAHLKDVDTEKKAKIATKIIQNRL